jgi:beta-alanine degradation protein BauB
MSSVPKPEVMTYPDAFSADPQHYQTLYEDDHIRVLRVQYGAHEESVMHGHPSTILIPLTTSKLRLTDYNGRIDVVGTSAWQAMQTSVGIHKPDNLADTPFEAIAIELKYVRPVSIRGSQRRQ